jgi:copper chaperone CopZ
MKISILFFMVIAIAITSCAQDTKKTEQAASKKEQAKETAPVKLKIPVDGMVCSACQSTIKKTVKSLNGVKDVEVSLENRIAFITYYPDLIKPEQIQKAINDKGFTAGKAQEVKQ